MLSSIKRSNGRLSQGENNTQTNNLDGPKKESPLLLFHGDHYFRNGTGRINPQVIEKQHQILRGQY